MGKQLPLFVPPPPTEDERLNEAQAAMRREQMARDAAKPGPRRARSRCPTCGQPWPSRAAR